MSDVIRVGDLVAVMTAEGEKPGQVHALPGHMLEVGLVNEGGRKDYWFRSQVRVIDAAEYVRLAWAFFKQPARGF